MPIVSQGYYAFFSYLISFATNEEGINMLLWLTEWPQRPNRLCMIHGCTIYNVTAQITQPIGE